jgi:hypothetical protein
MVTVLPCRLFAECHSLSTFTSPLLVTTIADDCFAGTSFQTFDLLPTVVNYGVRVFSNCRKLRSVDMTEFALPSLPECFFQGCVFLSHITFPHISVDFQGRTLYGCGFRTITFPRCIKLIGAESMACCAALTEVNMSQTTITQLPNGAFGSCGSLRTIVLPPAVAAIGSFAFSGTDLREFVGPASLRAIGSSCFWACPNLTMVSFAATKIKDLPSFALAGCSALSALYLPATLKSAAKDSLSGTSIAKLAFLGETDLSPKLSISLPLVLVPKSYRGNTFLGNEVKRSLTGSTQIPGIEAIDSAHHFPIAGIAPVFVALTMVCWCLKRRLNKKAQTGEDREAFLRPAEPSNLI